MNGTTRPHTASSKNPAAPLPTEAEVVGALQTAARRVYPDLDLLADLDRSLSALNMDSLGLLEVVTGLERQLNMRVDESIFDGTKNLRDFLQRLVDEILQRHPRPQAASAPSAGGNAEPSGAPPRAARPRTRRPAAPRHVRANADRKATS